ncbi:MAG: PhzF family phenazine biosynthesis protein [Acidimicrobiia bacterium]|nr:PhzF family phenazine biosynthesis protein [Acidimicrobiia bacterium]
MRYAFKQVDVFTDVPYRGNPVAVVLGAEHLSTEKMQGFAHWTNLSETTFVLPPTTDAADYRVRIFTPTLELPFAGHPTLGTCHAWLEAGAAARDPHGVVQECGIGLVDIRRDGDRLSFRAPPLVKGGPLEPEVLDQVTKCLGVSPDEIVDSAWVDNGPSWLAVRLADPRRVLGLKPSFAPLDIGVVALTGSDPQIVVRAFFPVDEALREDPVTGSLNASLAQWLLGNGAVTAPYRASQGAVLGRDGVVHIEQTQDGEIWVGGDTVTCVDGTVDF